MGGSWFNHYSSWRVADIKADVARTGDAPAALGAGRRPTGSRGFWRFGRRSLVAPQAGGELFTGASGLTAGTAILSGTGEVTDGHLGTVLVR